MTTKREIRTTYLSAFVNQSGKVAISTMDPENAGESFGELNGDIIELPFDQLPTLIQWLTEIQQEGRP